MRPSKPGTSSSSSSSSRSSSCSSSSRVVVVVVVIVVVERERAYLLINGIFIFVAFIFSLMILLKNKSSKKWHIILPILTNCIWV